MSFSQNRRTLLGDMHQPNSRPAAKNTIHRPSAGHNSHRAWLTLLSIAMARATAGAPRRARWVRDNNMVDMEHPSVSGMRRSRKWALAAATSIAPRYGPYLRRRASREMAEATAFGARRAR